MSEFAESFEKLTGNRPFPWQEALYERFAGQVQGGIPRVASIPTGLGKTNVIAVWLIALAKSPQGMPRRLAYVVNRRTVVDQTTREAEKLKTAVETGRFPGIDQLAISTLRGQFADNGEWFANPARPAVICGTVDMVGSRLLFSGYRIGFKARPLHAGFLGQDTLLVHDEAHLEPAFQQLVESIQEEQRQERDRNGTLPWPGLRVMALSATARKDGEKVKPEDDKPHELTEIERQPPEVVPDPPTKPIHHVWRRLTAKKALCLHQCEDEKNKLAEQIAESAVQYQGKETAVLIFVREVDEIKNVVGKLKGKGVSEETIETLTGTMRGYERDQLVINNPVFARFMPESDRPDSITPAEGTVYLVCTSAGEVGVNLSADQMVCDLSTFDSMAQRFGRVNRFGSRDDTCIDVIHPKENAFDDKKPNPQRKATLELLKQVNGNASPKALSELMARPSEEKLTSAFAPSPAIPHATDILFDAWAMTTIRDQMPGRPPVGPYLHGVAEWDPPRTSVAWRKEVEYIGEPLIQRHGKQLPETLLDDYPLKPHEILNDTTERIRKALGDIAKHTKPDTRVWLVNERGQVTIINLVALLSEDKKQVVERLAESTILLPPTLGGLRKGMLDGKGKKAEDVADEWNENDQRRRLRLWDKHEPPSGMALVRIIDVNPNAEEDALANTEDESDDPSKQRRFWHWYVRPKDAEDATPTSLEPVSWQDHTKDVEQHAEQIVDELDLPEDLRQAVVLAAELHDLGKQRELWQRSIGNPKPTEWYAKSGKPKGEPRWRPQHISDYRHEFGSLLDVLNQNSAHPSRLADLNQDMQDIVLHLIAAHHGYGRPHFPPPATVDPDYPQTTADDTAIEIMRRYARLQRRYGRWGLAYLESLLRAADWAASAKPKITNCSKEVSV